MKLGMHWEQGAINIHSRLFLKYKVKGKTTMGRIIFNRTVNDVLNSFDIKDEPFINRVLGKKELGDLVYDWYIKYGNEHCYRLADKLKDWF